DGRYLQFPIDLPQLRGPREPEAPHVALGHLCEETVPVARIVSGVGQPLPRRLVGFDDLPHLDIDYGACCDVPGNRLAQSAELFVAKVRMDFPDLGIAHWLRLHRRARSAPLGGGEERPVRLARHRTEQIRTGIAVTCFAVA